MPTAATSTWELAGTRLDALYPDEAEMDSIQLKPSTTYTRGQLLGEITATPGVYGPYAAGNADGTQNPNHILHYSCSTDAQGNISGIGEWGQTFPNTSAYMNGTFRTQELVGLDATALTRFGARLVEGTVTQGIVRVP